MIHNLVAPFPPPEGGPPRKGAVLLLGIDFGLVTKMCSARHSPV